MNDKQRLFLIAVGILIAGILIPNTPWRRQIPSRDAGVFLYVGQQILAGKVPYRDVWDHKPPLIHYIDALGLLIGNGSVWGVNLLEFVALYLAAVQSYVLVKRVLGFVPAVLAVIAWLVTLTLLLGGGNFTEEFALPCQFTAWYLFWQAEERGTYSWRGFLIGATGAVSFLLKQNLIGVYISIVLFLLLKHIYLRRWRSLLSHSMTMFLGATSVVLVVGLYFAHQGALGALWDSAFVYNWAYSTAAVADRIVAPVAGLVLMLFSGTSVVALVTWFAGVVYTLRDRGKIGGKKTLLILSIINLPIEFFLVAVSGKAYAHYYMAWLSVFAVLTGFFAYFLANFFYPRLRTISKIVRVIPARPCLFAFLSIWSIAALVGQMSPAAGARESTGHQVARYIEESTAADDYVLIWGAETSVNFAAHRQSPTRFIYQYPLYTRGYQSAALIKEFLDDIATRRPAIIVDTSPGNELIPPIDPSAREKWSPADENYGVLPAMDMVFDYLASNYHLKEKLGQAQWSIYVYVGE